MSAITSQVSARLGPSIPPIDDAAVTATLQRLLIGDPRTHRVVECALGRWLVGDGDAAHRIATDIHDHGIPDHQWRLVLAAALGHEQEDR